VHDPVVPDNVYVVKIVGVTTTELLLPPPALALQVYEPAPLATKVLEMPAHDVPAPVTIIVGLGERLID